jgi:dienelactone hydrolase
MKRSIAITVVLLLLQGSPLPASVLRFAADGRPALLRFGADGNNRVDASNPGNGFVVKVFTGSGTAEIRLESVVIRGDSLIAAGPRNLPRLTFALTRNDRYVAVALKRVEGLPAASLAAVHFDVVAAAADVRVISLDFMTRVERRDRRLRAEFNHLWHRAADDPLGGFALYPAGSDAEADESLLALWCGENLPRPAVGEPWTRTRARQWLDDYHTRFQDMTTMIIGAGSEKELYDITDLAARQGIALIYLHTDTWRGEYWPRDHSWLHVNEQVFPLGRADLRRYKDHLDSRGMKLALHTTCAGIGPFDPERIAAGVERNLASWCRGSLAGAISAEADTIAFRPAPGQDVPLAVQHVANGPGLRTPIFETNYVRIDDEIVRVGALEDTDRPVWTLRRCERGYGATKPAAHADGAEAVGLLSAYGQNFVPDNDSPLLEEMAREFAAFANEIRLDQLEYDAYEIHGSTPWGLQKFSDAVARHLDHPVVTNTSSGRPVPANVELLFSRIRDINQFGYSTVNLSLQLDGHRPATSLLDAWFELSSLAARGVRRFQILKPEPMFGVTSEILATHGLVNELFEAFSLWRDVTPLVTNEQWQTLRTTLQPFGNHMQGKDLFQVRRAAHGYDVVPTRVMLRRHGDVPWRVGQEFGPIGPRQFCQPGDAFEVENPYAAQPAGFVIRVLPELAEIGAAAAAVPAAGAATSARGDAIAESYRAAAAHAAGAVPAAPTTPATASETLLQPQATEIGNQRFTRFEQDGDWLVMTADNPGNQPTRQDEDQPGWQGQFSMAAGRGIAFEIDGDGSGAIVLLQLRGRGLRDYVVKVDFKGRRTVRIPCGEASWADGDWGWRMGSKHFDYAGVRYVSLGFGMVPPRSSPRIRIAGLRQLRDVPSKLVRPVIRIGSGSLAVDGEIETGCYLRYAGGDVATVYDRNWNSLRTLPVVSDGSLMPSGFGTVRIDAAADAPRPWLEVQTIVTGDPIRVEAKKPGPMELWSAYDPAAGDFREEIVREETTDGVYRRESYISVPVLGEDVRVYCVYAVKAGAMRAPGLLNVHGWMGAPAIDNDFVRDGWAVMSFDYCGKTGNRPHFTKYPEALRHGNMDRSVGPSVHSQQADGTSITDPRQASDFIWYCIQRRVLSYLEIQREVDPTRLGAKGYSYGGTLMWNLGTDPRVKAIVAYFGIGWTEYYRSKQIWMYDGRTDHPPPSAGEAIFLKSIAPEAHAPFITAATLWLNGSNDHHGGHERGIESFAKFKPGVPWAYAIQARGHHDTDKIGQDAKPWLEKYVLGKDIPWPDHPRSALRLAADGVPEIVVTPDAPERVRKVECFYALKEPCSFTRAWRDAASVRQGDSWVASTPVMNVDDYLFAYANITYDDSLVLSTPFNAAIPASLGAARATDKASDVIASDGYAAWTNVAELEGPQGIKAFRCTNNGRGSTTEQLHDPKWKAPEGAALAFGFYCTEPQTILLSVDPHNRIAAELEIPASDAWQEMVLPADRLIRGETGQPLEDWSGVGMLRLRPKAGSDLTKVLFANFRWVRPGE